MSDLHPLLIDPILSQALREDLGWGDLSTRALPDREAEATVLFKEPGVMAGLPVFKRVYELLDPTLTFEALVAEGERTSAGAVALLRGSARSILMGERVGLNFLQRLCGIATLTREMASLLPPKTFLLDTRKTTPGLRILEKYAVRMGGGKNHRFCLSDAAMIKDNHIVLAGGVKEAVRLVRAQLPATSVIEVEADTLFQVEQALEAGADIIMLDNMSIAEMKEAVKLVAGSTKLEASGNVDLSNIAGIAATGVDFISSGSLTRNVRSLDISLDLSGE
ncbi:MAG TPA: carboxylating nicotinate-nucleotide diphosphorylase [Chroococcales cyanobacterium]|jgi:nicotinate-nucleotide pyrophosphorylase (carboxylating)